MKPPRDVLKHLGVETAKAKRRCHRDRKHSIAMGERCLVVKEGTFAGSKNYCVPCALEILSACEARHAELRAALS